MRAAGLLLVVCVAVGAVQLVLGPTLAGAAGAVLVAVYGWGWTQTGLRRVEVRQLSLRTGIGLGVLSGATYASVGLAGWVELPVVGAGLVLAAVVVGVLASTAGGVLVLCGLDAAVSGKGGYAEGDASG